MKINKIVVMVNKNLMLIVIFHALHNSKSDSVHSTTHIVHMFIVIEIYNKLCFIIALKLQTSDFHESTK